MMPMNDGMGNNRPRMQTAFDQNNNGGGGFNTQFGPSIDTNCELSSFFTFFDLLMESRIFR